MTETVRKTRTFLGRREEPCRTAIKKLVEKFWLLGQVGDVRNKTNARRSRTAENIAAVAESAREPVTVNGLRYREMINDFLCPKLDSIDLATNPLIFRGKSFRTVLSLEEAITIGHRDLVI